MRADVMPGEVAVFLDHRTGRYEPCVVVEFDEDLVIVRDKSGGIWRVPEYHVEPPDGSPVR